MSKKSDARFEEAQKLIQNSWENILITSRTTRNRYDEAKEWQHEHGFSDKINALVSDVTKEP